MTSATCRRPTKCGFDLEIPRGRQAYWHRSTAGPCDTRHESTDDGRISKTTACSSQRFGQCGKLPQRRCNHGAAASGARRGTRRTSPLLSPRVCRERIGTVLHAANHSVAHARRASEAQHNHALRNGNQARAGNLFGLSSERMSERKHRKPRPISAGE